MERLNNLLEKMQQVLTGLETGKLIGEVVSGYGNDVLELQKIQLLEGKASSGEDMRPYYSEDLKPKGWFYSVETARNYAAWKQSLSYPYEAERNPDAPNLYINGRFHSELGVEFGPESVVVQGRTPYAQNIIAKFGLGKFGLTQENWGEVFRRGAGEKLMQTIKDLIYG